jgi:Flp pilus assembly pilin Flp
MWKLWTLFRRDESGQDLTEYALLVAFIAIGVMVALPSVRDAIGGIFDRIVEALGTVP